MSTDPDTNRILIVLNDPPYGNERNFNALRLGRALSKRDDTDVRIFLKGDAVACAKGGQDVPSGFYHLESMLDQIRRRGGQIGICGMCLDARGLDDSDLAEGLERGSTVAQLTEWTIWADNVMVY